LKYFHCSFCITICISDENKKVLSSFKNHKTLFVPIIRVKKEWNNRLNTLKETIVKWLTEIPESEITYEYLFYDILL
jgi:hypothetical protein